MLNEMNKKLQLFLVFILLMLTSCVNNRSELGKLDPEIQPLLEKKVEIDEDENETVELAHAFFEQPVIVDEKIAEEKIALKKGQYSLREILQQAEKKFYISISPDQRVIYISRYEDSYFAKKMAETLKTHQDSSLDVVIDEICGDDVSLKSMLNMVVIRGGDLNPNKEKPKVKSIPELKTTDGRPFSFLLSKVTLRDFLWSIVLLAEKDLDIKDDYVIIITRTDKVPPPKNTKSFYREF